MIAYGRIEVRYFTPFICCYPYHICFFYLGIPSASVLKPGLDTNCHFIFLCHLFACFFTKFFFPKLTKSITQVIAAHICYLVAEANFESYSDSARMCLIGADHWNQPRTYASPEAIQVIFNFIVLKVCWHLCIF